MNKVRLDYYDDQFEIVVDGEEVSKIYFDDDVSEIGEAILKMLKKLNIEAESFNMNC